MLNQAMVTPSGFEPLAYRLGGGRSILLSYGAKHGPIAPLSREKCNNSTMFLHLL
jgi:hypothetical protein